MMETWLLLFVLSNGDGFVGGEYYSERRCRRAIAHQINHWREHYRDPNIIGHCRIDKPSVIIIEGER